MKFDFPHCLAFDFDKSNVDMLSDKQFEWQWGFEMWSLDVYEEPMNFF